MIFNFFAQIFGISTYKSSEIITTTIVDNDPNIDVDDDVDDGDADGIKISSNNCYLMAASAPAAGSTMSRQRELDNDGSPLTDCNYRQSSLPFEGSGRGRDRGRGRDPTVQFQQQTNHKTNQTNDMNKSRKLNRRESANGISVYTVYTLFSVFLICICTIAALLMAYMNRMNDIAQLRADLNGKFVGRSDIDVIVRNILHELQIDDGGMSAFKRRWV